MQRDRGANGPVRSGSAARPDDRRALLEAPLLAADAEHLNPVDAGRVTSGVRRRLHSWELLGHGFGGFETAVAERDRRTEVLRDVDHERLRGLLGRPQQFVQLMPGEINLPESDERRNAPAHRLRLDLRVAQHRSQVPRLGHHREDLVQ